MSYVYGAMFIICGLILMIKLKSENKIFLPLGIYFILLGALRIVQTIWAVEALTWVSRVLSGIALAYCVVFYVRNGSFKKNSNVTQSSGEKKSKDDSGLF